MTTALTTLETIEIPIRPGGPLDLGVRYCIEGYWHEVFRIDTGEVLSVVKDCDLESNPEWAMECLYRELREKLIKLLPPEMQKLLPETQKLLMA